MKLDREDILKKSLYSERYGVIEFFVFSPFLDREVRVWVYSNHKDKDKDIDYRIVERVNSFIEIPISEIEKLKQGIYKHYELCTRTTDYGMVPQELIDKHGKDYERANKEYFGFGNKEDTFRATVVDYIYFDDYFDPDHLYFSIWFKVAWEDEHGISAFFKDKLIESIE